MPSGVYVRSENYKKSVSLRFKGKKLTKQHRINIGKGSLGHTLSQEARLNIGNAHKGKKLSIETKRKIGVASYKGEKVTYIAKHMWLYRKFGKANRCDQADETCKGRFEWSNVSNEYYRNIDDWQQLCASHHKRYDIEHKKGNK